LRRSLPYDHEHDLDDPSIFSNLSIKSACIYMIKEIIHGRHRVVHIYTWAGPLYSNFTLSDNEG